MRFHLGGVPASPDFAAEPPWRPLREPSAVGLQFYALPVGVAACVAFVALWNRLTPLDGWELSLDLPNFLLTLAGIIAVHELCHAVVHPGWGFSRHTVIGAWPSRGVFYAAYLGVMTRNRYVAIFLMPLIVISLAPLVVCAVAQVDSSWWSFVSCINAFFACGDLVAVGLLLWQVPAEAYVRNQGWQTYWVLSGEWGEGVGRGED